MSSFQGKSRHHTNSNGCSACISVFRRYIGSGVELYLSDLSSDSIFIIYIQFVIITTTTSISTTKTSSFQGKSSYNTTSNSCSACISVFRRYIGSGVGLYLPDLSSDSIFIIFIQIVIFTTTTSITTTTKKIL